MNRRKFLIGSAFVGLFGANVYIFARRMGNRGAAPETLEPERLESVVFSKSGNRLIARTSAGNLQFWDAASGKKVSDLQARHGGPLTDVAFQGNGGWLLTAGDDGIVKFWREGKPIETTYIDFGVPVTAVACRDGVISGIEPPVCSVAIGLQDATIRLHKHDVKERIWLKKAFTGAQSQRDERVRRKLMLFGEVAVLNTAGSDATSLEFSLDGDTLVSGERNGAVRVYRPEQWEKGETVFRANSEISDVAISPNGTHVAAATIDGNVWVIDLADGKKMQLDLVCATGHDVLAWMNDKIAVLCNDNRIAIFELATGQIKYVEGISDDLKISAIDVSADGKWLVSIKDNELEFREP